jgi:hypothetical protein
LKNKLPILHLTKHDETAWILSGQHTGLTDFPLTEYGERTARRLGERLQGLTFAKVFTSPLKRARQTCELAGFGALAEIDPDLVERDDGKYEGRRVPKSARSARTGTCSATATPEAKRLSKSVPCRPRRKPSPRDSGKAFVFTSRHFLRVLALRWLGLEPTANRILHVEHSEPQ